MANKDPSKKMYFLGKTSLLLILFTILTFAATTKPEYEFNQKGFLLPHPDKAYRGGEDAFFSSDQLLIVADGVGSWADFGIDPAFYARFLCSKGAQLFEQNKTFYRQNLMELIANASKLNENIGSSTMVAITLNGEKLRTCFIGDSGFVIFRLQGDEYKLFFEFKQQQHGFNFPFQLAMKEYYGDDPYLSVCQDFTIQETDIIVAGSDGLFDNVFVTEIMNLINMNFKEEEKLFTIPDILANMAVKRGADRKFQSPFSIKAQEQMLKYVGGKLDDTTVVLAKIKKIQQRNEDKTEPVKVEVQKTSIKGDTNVDENHVDPEEVSTFEVMGEADDHAKFGMQNGLWQGDWDDEWQGGWKEGQEQYGEHGEYGEQGEQGEQKEQSQQGEYSQQGEQTEDIEQNSHLQKEEYVHAIQQNKTDTKDATKIKDISPTEDISTDQIKQNHQKTDPQLTQKPQDST